MGLYYGLFDNTIARSIITKSIQDLKKLPRTISIKDGIIGVVPCLDILASRRFGQSLAALLEEVDSTIYKQVGYSISQLETFESTQLALYLSYRLNMTEIPTLYRSIWVSILGSLIENILNSFLLISRGAATFSLDYPPAFYLLCFLMGLKSGVNHTIFTKKFIAILPNVIECFPHSTSNKLYYYLVLQGIKKELHIKNDDLNKHTELLYSCISLDNIKDELIGKIYVGDGICGLYLLCHYLDSDRTLLKQISNYISDQLDVSAEIRRLSENPNYMINHIGLWDGVGGLYLTSLIIKLNQVRDAFSL